MNIIFHIDVNNAFLSWTSVYLLKYENYELDIRTIPSVIAGDPKKRHGIVLATSYPAKKYGIRTPESLYSAKNKCKDLQVYKPNYAFYKEMSDKLYNYYLTITPDVERYSIDECFLDLTNTSYLYDDVLYLAYKIKDYIKNEYGFTVNIGIANNKLCAKMAGDFSKPDKVHTLFDNEIKSKMWPLKVEDLLYVGASSSKELHRLGINTIGDLANYDLDKLKKYFKNRAYDMIKLANGLDDSKVISANGKNKCISLSKTLEYDTRDLNILKKEVLHMCEEIGLKLRNENLYASCIAITIKTDLFKAYSHQKKILNQTNDTMELYKNALELLEVIVFDNVIRNIGVRVSDLVNYKNSQMSLFDSNTKQDDVWKIIDNINNKYNNTKIMPAIFYKDDNNK